MRKVAPNGRTPPCSAMPLSVAVIACSRMPKCIWRASYVPASKSPRSLSCVLFETARSAEPPSKKGTDLAMRVERLARRVARRHRAVARREGRDLLVPTLRQRARLFRRELLGFWCVFALVARPQLVPCRLERGAALDGRAEDGERIVGHEELRVLGPAVEALRAFDLVLAERLAMRLRGVLLVGRAVADVRADADERWPRVGLRRGERAVDGVEVVGVLDGLRVPAVGFVAPAHVLLIECERGGALDGDVVVVVAHDEVAELQMSGQRCGFRRDAFHEIAVAADDVGVVVDDVEAIGVEARPHETFRDREADRVAEALPERSRGALDARRVSVLGMARASSSPTGGIALRSSRLRS